MDGRYEVILPNGDRIEAETAAGILDAADLIITEAADAGAHYGWLRRGAIYTADGQHIDVQSLRIRARHGA